MNECYGDFSPTIRNQSRLFSKMPKRPKKNRTGGMWPPVSPMAPLETQRVGQGLAGLFMAFDLYWSRLSGKNKDGWYDRVLHVIGGLLILGAFIGGAILLFIEHWKH